MMVRAGALVGMLAVGMLMMMSPPAVADCVADLDGDGDVDLTDLGIYLHARDSQPGDPNWNPRADFDGDGTIG